MRRWSTPALDAVAVAVVWLALLAPNDLADVAVPAVLGIPVEALALAALALVLPQRAVRPVGVALGLLLGLLAIVKVLDMGFLAAFGRPFDPPWDGAYLGSGIDLLSVSVGSTTAVSFVALAGILMVAVLVTTPWAMTRALGLARRSRPVTVRILGVGAAVWVGLAVWGSLVSPPLPYPSAATASLVGQHARLLVMGVRDGQSFDEAVAVDPLRLVPPDRLLDSLRGKDVIVAFVESYGRVAVEGSSMSAGVAAVLDDGTARLSGAGFEARSAYLTSPTFGGISWLAHATLQSGLWVDSQQRYDRLLAMDRTTLSSAFKAAGWRTVSVVPSNEQGWSEGKRFYGYDVTYDARNVGYRGPRFSYASMPDQYVLDAFRRLELERSPRPPVMAEIDLVSSHTPWTPLPTMVPWPQVGDGSAFAGMPALGPSRSDLWSDPDAVRAAYGASIEYTLSALVSFVETYGDSRLVLVVLGDHQPATIVAGPRAGHDVPVSIIAHDPAVLAAIDSWRWDPGLRPRSDAPVVRMDEFRDRFVAAYTPRSPSAGAVEAAP